MYAIITVLIVLAAILLILVVLVQNSKGGGLSSNFSASNQIMGVKKTTDAIEKATWGLASFIIVLSLASAAFIGGVKNNMPESSIQAPTMPASTTSPDVTSPITSPTAGEQAQPESN